MTPLKVALPIQSIHKASSARHHHLSIMLAFTLIIALVHLIFSPSFSHPTLPPPQSPSSVTASDAANAAMSPIPASVSSPARRAPHDLFDAPLHQRPSTSVVYDSDTAALARRSRPLPACARTPKRAATFLIVFMGHSGSSAILSELRQHPHIHVEQMELVDHQQSFNTPAALSTIRTFFRRAQALDKLPGFKIRPAHILANPAAFRTLLRDFDTRIIWQYRKNVFKASVGEYSTRYLNDSRAVEGLRRNISRADRCSEGIGCTFRIDDVNYLHAIMKAKVRSHHLISKAVEIAARGTGCVREIPYEDYLYDRQGTIRDIQRFLGVPYVHTVPQRFKATGDNMCRVVENWNEVCTALYGCITWQHMLDDVRNNCFCSYSGGPVSFCDAQNAPTS